MKRIAFKTLLRLIIILAAYTLLLNQLAGTNIAAGVFCPGPHLPRYYTALIALFLLSRVYTVLLPGLILSWIVIDWLKLREPGRSRSKATAAK